jgi:excinuclease ABC subunit C
VGAIDAEGYQQLVQSWARFFEGDVRQLRDHLQRQMDEASQKKHYEAAAKARDGLAALERAASAQSVVLDDHSNLDVIAIASAGSRAAVVRFRVRFGRIVGRTVHLVDRSMDEDDREILENALTEMYLDASSVPGVVVVQRQSLATALVVAYLGDVRGKAVQVLAAQRGKRRRAVELATHDAEAVINRDSLRRQADHNVRSRALQELGAALSLEQPPYRVECFDMSHLQGTNYVGSLVVFEDALPVKSDYRHFNVKEVLGNDDVGAMEEVVRRRLSHWEEHQGTSKFRHPDLIIIDGGLPQLHAAEKAARSLELSGLVEFAALAKREELLFRPGSSSPIALERGSESLYLVQRIRDEAHRFAITFHRSKRGRSMVSSSLEGVEGLGPARRDRLLERFGSLNALRQATFDELDALAWLPSDVAKRLYDHLQAPSTPRPTKAGVSDE